MGNIVNTYLITFNDATSQDIENELPPRVWENLLIFEKTGPAGTLERVRTYSLYGLRSWEQWPR